MAQHQPASTTARSPPAPRTVYPYGKGPSFQAARSPSHARNSDVANESSARDSGRSLLSSPGRSELRVLRACSMRLVWVSEISVLGRK